MAFGQKHQINNQQIQNQKNQNIAFLTDFSWTNEGDTYTISYPGTDMPNDIVRIKTKSNSVEKTEISENNELTYVLEETNGETLAIRE